MTTCQVRFMDNNFIGAALALSSPTAASGFPISNLYDPLRSKIAKFAGTFVIETGVTSLHIKDTLDRVVTLTPGEYTATTLASHIQTKCNAVSSGWTCTHDGTRFTISNSNPAYQVRASVLTAAAWDVIGFTGATDHLVPAIADETRIHTRERFLYDFGLPMPATAFCMVGPISTVFSLSQSATVTIRANSLNLWTSPPLSETATITEAGAFHFLPGDAYRYWVIDIADRTNPSGISALNVGHMYLGDYLTLATSNVATGFSKKYVDPSEEQVSESGVRYYNTRPKYREFSSMEIQVPAASERRTLEQLWHDNGLHTSFYVAIDPLLGVSATYDEMTVYCNFAGEPEFKHVIRDYYSMSFELREAV